MPLTPIYILGALSLVLLTAGAIEFWQHQRSLAAIPLRIHVNGTRGKSSVTRLIAAGLRAGGLRTFAKTTGTAPRVIDSQGKDRIIHRLRSASIGEQVRLIRFFAQEKPDAVVMECMAVQPQYQWISEQQMVKSHIGVITNARPDHLEEMGPTLDDVRLSLANTIPFNGKMIVGENDMVETIASIAKSRNTDLNASDEFTVLEEDMKDFTYLEHPQNVAVALDVCVEAGVDKKIALEGMKKVKPDLGALVVQKLDFGNGPILFINSMAANDPVSTLQIWNFVERRYPVEGETCIYLNSREDRRSRTRQLLQLIYEDIKPDRSIVRGQKVNSMVKHVEYHSPQTSSEVIEESESMSKTIKQFEFLPKDSLLFAMGNQVGFGQELIDKLLEYKLNG
ncbi:MAG: poly-gamma-glutamate synthase PgsB [Candidatus Marinimicrobia bacterium]|nr:poly-gamma-glutamate synthase PgsB [Candidatus Neomarinimicrobiota bacterium]